MSCDLEIRAAMEQFGIQQAIARRERRREASWRKSEGVPDLPIQSNQLFQDQEGIVREEALKYWMIASDIDFARKLMDRGDDIDTIHQTISKICEARMDQEIKQAEECHLQRNPGVLIPEENAFEAWQDFLREKVFWGVDDGEVAKVEGTSLNGVPTGMYHQMRAGEWCDDQDNPVPMEVEENLSLCEMSEDMDVFDLETDLEHLMRHSCGDGGVLKGRPIEPSKDGPLEEMGVKVDIGVVDTKRNPCESIYYDIYTTPQVLQITYVGDNYHTATWKYGKSFVEKWDLEKVDQHMKAKKTLRLAGGVLRWRAEFGEHVPIIQALSSVCRK